MTKFIKTLILLSLCSLFTCGCTTLIFQPDRNLYALPYQQQIERIDIEIKDEHQPTLHGWYLPTKQVKKGSILFLHGNAQNISTHTQFVYWLPDEGYDVYTIDYRGYGHSEGHVDLAGAIIDVQRAIAHIARHSNDDLIVMGHSLGGAIAIPAVASLENPPVEALIVASAFSDYHKIIREFLARNLFTKLFSWPLSFTVNNDYSPTKWIDQTAPIPSYFLYSDNDGVIPPWHSPALYQRAAEPKHIEMIIGGHNDFLALEENRKTLIKILNTITQQHNQER